MLEIDNTTGEIFTRIVFDRENLSTVYFNVFAFSKHATATEEGTLLIKDENDNPPVFEDGNSLTITFNPSRGLGCEITRIIANDLDQGICTNI